MGVGDFHVLPPRITGGSPYYTGCFRLKFVFFRVVSWFPSFNIYNFHIQCGNIPVTIIHLTTSKLLMSTRTTYLYRQGV